MQGGAPPHALNALVLGFVLRLRQHRRQALGGSFRQGPWCSHAKPPASASLPLFMIVRKRISMSSNEAPPQTDEVYVVGSRAARIIRETAPVDNGELRTVSRQ